MTPLETLSQIQVPPTRFVPGESTFSPETDSALIFHPDGSFEYHHALTPDGDIDILSIQNLLALMCLYALAREESRELLAATALTSLQISSLRHRHTN